MKTLFIIKAIPGFAGGVYAGLVMKNIPAGIALGMVAGLLLALVQTSTEKIKL